MSARSLNKVMLIGNLVRDAEVRYTQGGTAVATVNIATNREWKDGNGQKQEETEFHRCIAWSKLAEICGQYMRKGGKVYIEGRLTTRKWTDKEGVERFTTEIVMDTMMLLGGNQGHSEQLSNEPAIPDEVIEAEGT